MTDNGTFRYVGDETGTVLERTEYEVVAKGPENVVLQPARTTETVEVPKEEFQAHLDSGALKPDG